MSNSGSGGAWSGFDSIPPDYRHTDGDPAVYPWDSSRPLPKDLQSDSGEDS